MSKVLKKISTLGTAIAALLEASSVQPSMAAQLQQPQISAKNAISQIDGSRLDGSDKFLLLTPPTQISPLIAGHSSHASHKSHSSHSSHSSGSVGFYSPDSQISPPTD